MKTLIGPICGHTTSWCSTLSVSSLFVLPPPAAETCIIIIIINIRWLAELRKLICKLLYMRTASKWRTLTGIRFTRLHHWFPITAILLQSEHQSSDTCTVVGEWSFSVAASRIWNSLPPHVTSLQSFKKRHKPAPFRSQPPPSWFLVLYSEAFVK